MKKLASMCEGRSAGRNTPETVKSRSPFVLLLMCRRRPKAGFPPNSFCASGSASTIVFGDCSAVLPAPSMN